MTGELRQELLDSVECSICCLQYLTRTT